MEYAVYIFLETKEVNYVLCSEYKPHPARPPLDFENLCLRPTVIRLEGPKQFPEEGGMLMQTFDVNTDFSCGIINWKEGGITAVIVISSFTQLHLTMQKS